MAGHCAAVVPAGVVVQSAGQRCERRALRGKVFLLVPQGHIQRNFRGVVAQSAGWRASMLGRCAVIIPAGVVAQTPSGVRGWRALCGGGFGGCGGAKRMLAEAPALFGLRGLRRGT